MKMILPPTQIYRRNSILLLILLFGLTGLKAQTTIYFQDFNSGTAPEWGLNVTAGSLAGSTSTSKNYWLINNVFASNSSFVNNTPDEPAGITGYPESYYMHVTNGNNSGLDVYNANFDAPATGAQVAAMN